MKSLQILAISRKQIAAAVMMVAMCFGFFAFAGQAKAANLDELQTMIQSLLARVAELQSQLNERAGSMADPEEIKSQVGQITDNVGRGSSDYGSEGNVTRLQRCLERLGYYDEDVTGYFGPVTENAVKRFQAAERIVSSGTPDTTGYGNAGPSTRAAINKKCAKSVSEKPSDDRDYDKEKVSRADLYASPRSGAAPLQVEFEVEDVPTGWFGGVVLDYGDGNDELLLTARGTWREDALEYTYDEAGSYTARLIAIGEGSRKTLDETRIKVYEADDSDIEVNDDEDDVNPCEIKKFSSTEAWARACGYTLEDVTKVTSQYVDPYPNAIDDEYTLYTVYLDNGETHEVIVRPNVPRDYNEKQFTETGFSGDYNKLIAMAADVTDNGYTLDDVRKVTEELVDPRPGAIDDGYTLYTVYLHNGDTHEVTVRPNVPRDYNEKQFTETGFSGDYNKLIAMARKTEEPKTDSCYNDGKFFDEGTETQSVTDKDGSTRVIADAYLVCRDGQWETEGSYPALGTSYDSDGSVKGITTTNQLAQLGNALASLAAVLETLK